MQAQGAMEGREKKCMPEWRWVREVSQRSGRRVDEGIAALPKVGGEGRDK